MAMLKHALPIPLHRPLSLFMLLCLASLAATHWTEIKLQQEFWQQWSLCLVENLITLSLVRLFICRWIPQAIQARPLGRIHIVYGTLWVLCLTFYATTLSAHERQYLALTKITNDIHAFPLPTGASMAITALTVTSTVALLTTIATGAYKFISTIYKS